MSSISAKYGNWGSGGRGVGGSKKGGKDDVPEDPLLLVLLCGVGAGGQWCGGPEVVGNRLRARTTALRDAALGGVGQGERLGGGLLAGSVLGNQEGLGSVGAHGRGGGTGRAGKRAGGQGGLADGDGRGEHADLLVGGLLDGALKLPHLIHRHVWIWEVENGSSVRT